MFDPILADIRFGCGLSPKIASPISAYEMLAGLIAPDEMARKYPIETFPTFRTRMQERTVLQKALKAARKEGNPKPVRKQIQQLKAAARKEHFKWMAAHLNRRIHSATPMLERLESFWADHFTATGKAGLLRRAVSPYVESAIRPHLTGRFEDLLISAVTHPLMVHYLDQKLSIGPNSDHAKMRKAKVGLNENLAREILELHTLGVDGPYSQTDVRELAELLTGLTFGANQGRYFRKDFVEPGQETVLGMTYGGDPASIADVETVLRDLARHPATARHIAGKLAIHFVSDQPDPSLVDALETAYLDSGGALGRVYEALLIHPTVWNTPHPNVKQPFDFVASALRALTVSPDMLADAREKDFRRRIFDPMRLMGHTWQKPNGPDGLEEIDSAWITPQGIAARLQWAVAMPQLLQPDLPDPRDFVENALGHHATKSVRFAAKAAESRADGIGLVLASPAFQRM